MRQHHVQFTIRSLMTVVAVSALVVSPFAWVAPASRWSLLIGILTIGSMTLIVASPFLIDRLDGGQKFVARTGPGGRRLRPLTPVEPDSPEPER